MVDLGTGLLGLGAAIAIAGSAIGAAWAEKEVGAAAIGAIAEKEELFAKSLLLMVIPETLVIFGLVVFVLGRYAWKPILSGLASREAFIRASLESAKRDRDEAEARLKEYADKLVEARSEATAILEEARRDAEVARRKMDEEARAEAAALFERAKREIGIAQEDATQQLYSLAAQLSTQVAAKVLEREINPQDHARLIRQGIDRLGRSGN